MTVSTDREVAFPRMYPGSTVVEVIDGDTVRIEIDLGFNIAWTVSVRLHGVAAREKRRPGGPEARDHLAGLIPAGTLVDVLSVRWDKYAGRVQGVLFHATRRFDVGATMIKDGYAAPWDGTGPQPEAPWPIPAG